MRVFETEIQAAEFCQQTIQHIVSKKKDALMCLAAGHTSLILFDLLRKSDVNGDIDFSKIKIVGLDEWVGLSGRDDGSCENFLRKNLFDHIGIKEENIRLFDGKVKDLHSECKSVEAFIKANGGIDYMLLGVGMNGHLGLNEPGVDVNSTASVVKLDDITMKVADKYFEQKLALTGGVTLGIQNILHSDVVQVLITGKRKSEIVKRIMDIKETNLVPATLIKNDENVTFILDSKAASHTKNREEK